MKILCLDTPIASALSRMGHDVWSVRAASGVVDILKILETRGTTPDLIIQSESLRVCTFLRNLDQVDCPKIFWAFDTHLNIYWHKYYSRLFDAVCTPHVSFFTNMPESWTPKRLFRLARPAYDLPFRPHRERQRSLGFVGRDLADTRPLRRRFFELLKPLGLVQQSGLNTREMLEAYADTRIVPNEAIGFEVNFRLTEAASAGACVLSPDVGEDQDDLFQPGKEIMVYRDGLDMEDKLRWLLANPETAEKTGLAAWLRIRNSHLPVHRAEYLMRCLREVEPRGADPMGLFMALAQRGRHMRQTPPRKLIRSLENHAQPEAMALSLRCLCEFYPGDETEYKVLACLSNPALSSSQDILLTCLGYALHREDMGLFNSFWALWHVHWPHARPERPASLYEACLKLAELLQRMQRNFQPGFRFDPKTMLPETAIDALQMARLHAGEDREWAGRLVLLTSKTKALTQVRQQVLQEELKVSPGWRVRLDYALAALEAYDTQIGLEQLRQARQEAVEHGREKLLSSILKSRGLDSRLSE